MTNSQCSMLGEWCFYFLMLHSPCMLEWEDINKHGSLWAELWPLSCHLFSLLLLNLSSLSAIFQNLQVNIHYFRHLEIEIWLEVLLHCAMHCGKWVEIIAKNRAKFYFPWWFLQLLFLTPMIKERRISVIAGYVALGSVSCNLSCNSIARKVVQENNYCLV